MRFPIINRTSKVLLTPFFTNPFKWIVHPKMKILSSFTHLHVVPNQSEFLSSVEHKRRYFEECWKAIDLYYESQRYFVKEISRRWKLVQVWNDM